MWPFPFLHISSYQSKELESLQAYIIVLWKNWSINRSQVTFYTNQWTGYKYKRRKLTDSAANTPSPPCHAAVDKLLRICRNKFDKNTYVCIITLLETICMAPCPTLLIWYDGAIHQCYYSKQAAHSLLAIFWCYKSFSSWSFLRSSVISFWTTPVDCFFFPEAFLHFWALSFFDSFTLLLLPGFFYFSFQPCLFLLFQRVFLLFQQAFLFSSSIAIDSALIKTPATNSLLPG